jgi:hypothetical protein
MEEERLKICRACSIYNSIKEQCSSILYVNPENNDISLMEKPGYFKGCGCFVPSKVKRESNHCPAGKW